jgi:hypothetical protein
VAVLLVTLVLRSLATVMLRGVRRSAVIISACLLLILSIGICYPELGCCARGSSV